MGKDAYYFRHDANASDDAKIQMAEHKYGVIGYAWYFKILEVMRSERGYKIQDKPFNWNSLAAKCKTTPDKVKEFVDDCVKDFELFSFEKANGSRLFYSVSFLERMAKLDNMIKQRSNAAKAMHEKAGHYDE